MIQPFKLQDICHSVFTLCEKN